METMTTDKVAAYLLRDRLTEIDLDDVPINPIERRPSRKVLALAARTLFKHLGLRGISVTAPRYSMAQAVDIDWPRVQCDDCERNMRMCEPTCTAREQNSASLRKLRAIIEHAFPNCRNRSDSQTDYYDYCWSFC